MPSSEWMPVLARHQCAFGAPIRTLATPVQAVQGANSTFWVLGNGGLDGVYSLLHLAMDGGFISLKTFPVFGTRQPSLTLDGNDLYVLLNSQQSDPFGVTTHVLKLDQDGTVVQQLAFRGDSLDFLFEGMQWVEGVGLVLAGRSFQNQSSLAVIGLDSSLNVQWAHTGPSIPFSSNLPLLVRELNGPLVAVVWSADNPEPLGGLLVLNASGEVVESFSHTMSDVADVQPLQDNGWLFLRGFIQGPILLRHFGEDGIQLGSGSTSGTLVGQLWANGIEGSWTVLSGSWNTGDMSMARFNLEDGTCLPDPTMPVNLSADTVQLQPLALHTVELPVPIGSGECLTYPLEVTRTVNCGTLAVEELHATNIRCQQLQASGQGVAIVLHGDLPNNAEVQLFDAMGRELPTNVFQTETQKNGHSTARTSVHTDQRHGHSANSRQASIYELQGGLWYVVMADTSPYYQMLRSIWQLGI
jgi:hypothetical protein